ncbi:MAG TPA: glycosyltransferase [Steroidobacteraceae bacterium]|nr:glycosyltransferase [Steroidobacteraceae bacterium]
MNSSTVLIIAEAFHPSNEIGARRATALARYLAVCGIRVVVVSAFGGEPIERGCELYPGVIAVPVARRGRRWVALLVTLKRKVLAPGKATPGTAKPAAGAESQARPVSLGARLRERYFQLVYFVDDYKRWTWHAARAAVRAGRQHGAALILVSAPPHSSLFAGAWAARRLGIPYVADLRDPWSDFLADTHPNRRIELRLLRALEGWVMRRAAAITSTGATAARLLVGRDQSLAGRIHVIRNGYDGAIAPRLSHTGGRLSILFAGVLYIRRNPYPLLSALERLLSRPEVDPSRIQVTFMGDKDGEFSGHSLQHWLEGQRCASVVRILPAQSAERVAAEMAQATVLLNFAQQQPLHIPAKTYEHLASGREVLLICEASCETARLVAGMRGVIQVDQSDHGALEAVLLDLYRRHVVAGTLDVPAEGDVRRFSRALSNERFYEVLSRVATFPAPLGPSCGLGLEPSSPG